MTARCSRRQWLAIAALAGVGITSGSSAQIRSGMWSLPIREPGRRPGDGFIITRAYACENPDKHPGWWHTAEDWRLAGGRDTAGAEVLAVADGKVVFAAFDYPGRVLIVAHESGMFSVYGHLDYALEVSSGDQVVAGQIIGRVLAGTNWNAHNHLHFEIRNFYLSSIVNGASPLYSVKCGVDCPPGPGYWPMIDGRHPAELGWRNPTHVIGRGLGGLRLAKAQVASTADGWDVTTRAEPVDDATPVATLSLLAEERLDVVGVHVGDAATVGTSALAYDIWFRLRHSNGNDGWLRAMVADNYNSGSDGLPASVRPILLPITDS